MEEPLHGMGDEFNRAEDEARVELEDARALLLRWDEHDSKRMEFNAAIEALTELGMGKARAKKQVIEGGKYQYDSHFLMKHRTTLESNVKRALKRYATYRPDANNYAIGINRPDRERDRMKVPVINDSPLIDIANTRRRVWCRWPEEVKVSGFNISYAATPSTGIGPGERMLAYIFAAEVQGLGVPFDLVMQDRSTWEVKQVLTKRDLIRPGSRGTATFERASRSLSSIMRQLMLFIDASSRVENISRQVRKKLRFIKSIVRRNYNSVVYYGEVSRERFLQLRAAIMTASSLLHERKKYEPMSIVLRDNAVIVDDVTFIDVAHRVKCNDALKQIDDFDVALACLKHEAFIDPTAFFNAWFMSVKPSDVFSHSDGMIAVNEGGFMLVDRDDLDVSLRFDSVSQGLPKFLFTAFGDGPVDSVGKKIALIAMSGKPVHAGHIDMIKIAARECDTVKVFVSTADRNRPGEFPIVGAIMHDIWKNQLETILPNNVTIEYVQVPVKNVWENLAAASATTSADTYVLYADPIDAADRYPVSSLEKYAQVLFEDKRIIVRPVPRTETVNVSGTEMRTWLASNDKASFVRNLPEGVDVDMIWDALRRNAA